MEAAKGGPSAWWKNHAIDVKDEIHKKGEVQIIKNEINPRIVISKSCSEIFRYAETKTTAVRATVSVAYVSLESLLISLTFGPLNIERKLCEDLFGS
jgi:hypothetical protein